MYLLNNVITNDFIEKTYIFATIFKHILYKHKLRKTSLKMNVNRYILLLILMVVFPILVSAQIYRAPTKREAEEIGKKTYTLSNGETTKVVNTVGSGLRDSYADFLFRKTHTAEVDSIFLDNESDYSGLEEAALDVDRLLREVDLEKKLNNGNNDALAFRLAREHRSRRKKEQVASQIADSLLKRRETSVEELASRYVNFDGKPTYYINGVEVAHSVVSELFPGEVIKRETRVTNTASGNPYGEIWFLVSDKTLDRLKIPVYLTNDFMQQRTTASAAVVDPTVLKKRPEPAPLPVVRRETTADGKTVDVVIKDTGDSNAAKESEEERVSDGRTRVISRTVNDQWIQSNESESPTNGVRPASQPVMRKIK